MAAYYRCKVCGEIHMSPLEFVDRESLEHTRLSGAHFPCQRTRELAEYERKEMFWSDEELTLPGVREF